MAEKVVSRSAATRALATMTQAKLAVFALLVGCTSVRSVLEPAPDAATADAPVDSTSSCSPVTNTRVDRSLAVTDPAVLARFSFQRVMQQILAANGAAGQTTKQLYQKWMSTFGPSDCTNASVDPNNFGETCPRTHEAKLAAVDATNPQSSVQFIPVAVFDRFDLAPGDGANCGEYRIVFAMQSTSQNIIGRGFLIFEATLPNPSPAAGLAGCLPIARFWQGLSALASSDEVAAALDDFYFSGTAVPGVPAVVDAANYGATGGDGRHGPGQIRTNMFVDGFEWQLREFKASASCVGKPGCTLAFQHVAVAANPANELFDGTSPLAAEFTAEIVGQVAALAAPTIETIGMTFDPRFDEFESVSSPGGTDVLYDQIATPQITNAIGDQLIALGSPLTSTDILRRATTQTCAGCHFLSAGDVGGGLQWTPTTFVHVDEQSGLSPPLVTAFLPHRQEVLDRFVSCAGSAKPVARGMTIGGSRVGAPN